jgi:hypothetical protein
MSSGDAYLDGVSVTEYNSGKTYNVLYCQEMKRYHQVMLTWMVSVSQRI